MILNPFVGTSAVGSGGVSYFFEERFEGTGYQNSWTESGTGTIDEDYTGVVLEGSQSLRLAATAQNPRTTVSFASDQDELWMFFQMRIVVELSAARPIVVLQDASDLAMVSVQLTATNTIVPFTTTIAGTASVDAMVTGTNYNVWLHAVKGTGSDGLCQIGFSTTGTEVTAGNAFCQKNNGANVNDFRKLQVRLTNPGGTNTTGEVIFDKFLVSNTATIGNDPA